MLQTGLCRLGKSRHPKVAGPGWRKMETKKCKNLLKISGTRFRPFAPRKQLFGEMPIEEM